MKKLISIVAIAASTAVAFATGVTPVNAPQSGVASFTSTNQTATISFSPSFSTTPIVQLFASSTNATPLTNTVTTTNLTISTASTNVSVAWNAYVGYPRLQSGTSAIAAGASVTNTFNPPYAFAPTVSVSGTSSASNSYVGVTISTTNVILTCAVTNNVSWQAIGTAYAPGSSIVTY